MLGCAPGAVHRAVPCTENCALGSTVGFAVCWELCTKPCVRRALVCTRSCAPHRAVHCASCIVHRASRHAVFVPRAPAGRSCQDTRVRRAPAPVPHTRVRGEGTCHFEARTGGGLCCFPGAQRWLPDAWVLAGGARTPGSLACRGGEGSLGGVSCPPSPTSMGAPPPRLARAPAPPPTLGCGLGGAVPTPPPPLRWRLLAPGTRCGSGTGDGSGAPVVLVSPVSPVSPHAGEAIGLHRAVLVCRALWGCVAL